MTATRTTIIMTLGIRVSASSWERFNAGAGDCGAFVVWRNVVVVLCPTGDEEDK